jgi:hypothetical protein
MYPHRIRLRGPWERESADGQTRHRRHFHWPSQIQAHERVWLTWTGGRDSAQLSLNGTLLGARARGAFEHDVTALVARRNALVIEVEAGSGEGPLCCDVALEVRCLAFLREVRWWIATEGDARFVHATGAVVGTSDRALDLYLLLDGANAAYSIAQPTHGGQPFQLSGPFRRSIVPGKQHRVTLDLVNGASLWYRAEGELLAGEDAVPGR